MSAEILAHYVDRAMVERLQYREVKLRYFTAVKEGAPDHGLARGLFTLAVHVIPRIETVNQEVQGPPIYHSLP